MLDQRRSVSVVFLLTHNICFDSMADCICFCIVFLQIRNIGLNSLLDYFAVVSSFLLFLAFPQTFSVCLEQVFYYSSVYCFNVPTCGNNHPALTRCSIAVWSISSVLWETPNIHLDQVYDSSSGLWLRMVNKKKRIMTTGPKLCPFDRAYF